jgi:hypothetical protein
LEQDAESWIVVVQMPICRAKRGWELFTTPNWEILPMSTKDKLNPHMRTILAACANQTAPQDIVDYLQEAIKNGSESDNFGFTPPTPDAYDAADNWMDQQLQQKG